MKIAVMPGDGIGQEVTDQAVKVLKAVVGHRLSMELVYAPVGQAGVDAAGDPLPLQTREIADKAEAILFGSAGVPGDEKIEYNMRPGASCGCESSSTCLPISDPHFCFRN
jgi:3-isopropylmalate dehydrogenase